jgi:rhamnosyltransferase
MKLKVAGVCVLFNPIDEMILNINSYIDELGILYLIDNSDKPLSDQLLLLKTASKQIKYICNNKNLGIATALNIAARYAIQEGYEWLLTMDQDSKASLNMLSVLYDFIQNTSISNIGIVAAQPDTPIRKKRKESGYTVMDTVITSGNLVNLNVYTIVGGFEDKFFIDYVDHYFSLGVRQNGYCIIQVNNAVLHHTLGNSSVKCFFEIKMILTNHNHLRKFYMTRNRLYLYKKYFKVFPMFVFKDMRQFFIEIIKILLYEDNKLMKLKYICVGISAYLRNEFGEQV